MKNTYFITYASLNSEGYAILYCKETNQIFMEDGGDGSSSECEDVETLVAYATQLFGAGFYDLDDIVAEILHSGSELTEDDCYGSGAATWIAAQEE